MAGTQSLLLEYVQKGSERAFRELVTAYIDFVFSTALRIVGGDRHLAEDITQTVFADLAGKAATLPADLRLGGWLHRHTCFVSRKTLRRERRRVAREQQAVRLLNITDYNEANLAQLALVLDEAINDLGDQDRHAIVLRFFENLDFRSIGHALGSSEDAARMRVARAVEKMGSLLKRRGVVLSLSGLGFVLTAGLASAAPEGLANKVSRAGLLEAAKVPSLFVIFRSMFSTRLMVGTASAIVLIAALLLLLPARHPRTGSKANGPKMTPGEFAELCSDDSEMASDPMPAARPNPAPAPNVQPLPVAAKPAQPPPAPSVAVNPPVSQPLPQSPPPVPALPPPSNPVPAVPASNPGQAVANTPFNPGFYPPRPQIYYPPYQPAVPAPPAPNVPESKSSRSRTALVSSPSGQPWAPVATVATIQPGGNSPSAAATRAPQPQRTAQPLRSPFSARPNNDPRNRDRQP
jgi:RNA polymerase sigma factor (sigma-70 family)